MNKDDIKIREIEALIDKAHECSSVFSLSRNQAYYNLLVAFENLSETALICGILNPASLSQIHENMDALSQAMKWAGSLCADAQDIEKFDLTEKEIEAATDLLCDYALPYTDISTGYILYSREELSAKVDGNIIQFDLTDEFEYSSWADILREQKEKGTNSVKLEAKLLSLIQNYPFRAERIQLEDGKLKYSVSEQEIKFFCALSEEQWNATKTLPEVWKFDEFSLDEYRKFWIALATICYIHFFKSLQITDERAKYRNAIMVCDKADIEQQISKISCLDEIIINSIVDTITYEDNKGNEDIMYQPIVKNNKMLFIAPILIMGSNPERNLISLIGSRDNGHKDTEYSRETGQLEEIMANELIDSITKDDTIRIIKHKDLPGELPDIDLAILDIKNANVLFCELKWLTAADSVKEVYYKKKEISHGCKQVEKIISYAMKNKEKFFKDIFEVDNGSNIDIFECVVARHNIRTRDKYVPVIDLNTIEDLFRHYTVEATFHKIRNKDYLIRLPEHSSIGYKEVNYAGYIFKIPAIEVGF